MKGLRPREGILNRNQLGGKNIMWASDYPHAETTWPESRAYIDRLFEGVPPPEKEAIVCETARRLYRLG
jgi:predicted TIM-barrel fold metal-dependent hydrolase